MNAIKYLTHLLGTDDQPTYSLDEILRHPGVPIQNINISNLLSRYISSMAVLKVKSRAYATPFFVTEEFAHYIDVLQDREWHDIILVRNLEDYRLTTLAALGVIHLSEPKSQTNITPRIPGRGEQKVDMSPFQSYTQGPKYADTRVVGVRRMRDPLQLLGFIEPEFYSVNE